MSFFHRFLGKKPQNQDTTEPEQIQDIQLAKESPEKENTVAEHKLQMDDNPVAKNEVPGEQKSPKVKPETDKTSSTQTQPWRTFSIFISSTFADMQAERDHLKNVVFPMVEEDLQKRRIKLEIVDLRWGVDTTSMAQEDEREASVLKVCLDEIRRCRPFFIGLLGDRYGWVPPLERMKTALIGEKHIEPEKGKSVTDLEIEFGVLASQYQLVRSVFYFREPLPYATFSKKKAAMFSDEYNDELSEAEKQERKTALIKLKAKIVAHFIANKLKNKVKPYSGIWNAEKEKLTGLATWGNIVYVDILAECESHAKETWDKVPQNWQEQELALLDAFIENNTTTFCGRKPLLETLKQHLLSGDSANWGLVLTGESGSGKSAVFSMMNKMMQQEDCFILAHSAGLSPRAKKVADLLQIWNRQLADHLGIKEDLEDVIKNTEDLTSRLTSDQEKTTTTPIEKLQEKFLELLQLASAKKRVVLLIDALDRFEPTARAQHMSWLASLIPQNVRLLCTAITGTEKKAVQYHKGLTTKSIDSFTSAESKEMLDALCLRQHKTLPAKIEKIILDKKRADGQPSLSSPLWLSIAVNMLMAIDHEDFEKMSQLEGRGDKQIESYLVAMANGFDPLPGPLFLSLKNKAGILFGETLTTTIFNFIAVSRNGLREKDLEKLLPAANIAWDSLQFANLRRWFKAHLVLQGEELQWNLAHSILRSALIQKIEKTQHLNLHSSIAEYLLILRNDPLKASETIYHLLNANKQKEATLYYGSDLNNEEAEGATTVLTDIATTGARGLEVVSNLLGSILTEFQCFPKILKRFVNELDNSLKIEGNLTERLNLLQKLKENIENTPIAMNGESFHNTALLYGKLGAICKEMGHMKEALNYFDDEVRLLKQNYKDNPQDESLKHNLAVSYGAIGNQHQSMGQMEEALKYFELCFQLSKELFETNPLDELVKQNLTASYKNLGDIHQSMGHMLEALKYFELRFQLSKEIFDANPLKESVKNGLAISYKHLGEIHQLMGHIEDAHKYFLLCFQLLKELHETNPRDELLKRNLAESNVNVGKINQSMGRMEESLKHCRDGVRLFGELFEANSLNESIKNGLAASYTNLGDIHQSMGNLEEALRNYNYANRLFEELYKDNPLHVAIMKNLSSSYVNLGDIHQLMGHMEEALKYFNNAVRLNKELCKDDFKDKLQKNCLSVTYERLGTTHQAMGHMEEALKYLELYFQLSKELFEANSWDDSLKNGLASSNGRLGDIHLSMGHMKEAIQYFDNGVRLFKEINEANPFKESYKNSLVVSYERLGTIYRDMGQIEEALKYFELRFRFSKELYEANPLKELYKNSLAVSWEKLGEIYQSMGNLEEALRYYENLTVLGTELYEANPQSESIKSGLATLYSKLGDIHHSMGHMDEALKYFDDEVRLFKELFKANPLNVEVKQILSILYGKIGKIYQTIGHNEYSGQTVQRFRCKVYN